MPSVIINPLVPATINQSETDTVLFTLGGTLNIAGTAAAPITVTLSQVAGGLVGSTINISNADVQLDGVAGVSALITYNVGSGGTLRLNSTLNVSAGSLINLSGTNSNLVIGNGVDLTLFNAINGFGPTRTIDLSGLNATRVAYTDRTGTNTGGTLTLLDANGGTLSTLNFNDGEFTADNFRLAADGAAGTLISYTTDATPPTQTSFTANPGSGQLGVGQVVTLTAAVSEPVTVTGGTPSLLLSDGGSATYDPTSSTSTSLVFRHTVQAGQNTPDLAVVGASLNGTTIADAAGNAFNLATLVTNPAGTLVVDTTAPTVTAVSTDPGSGTLAAGQVARINVATSEAVTVTGTAPTLTLSDGGTAVYNAAASTPTSLAFDHVVLAGQNTPDLSITRANVTGTTIADAAANLLNLSAAAVNPAGILAVNTSSGQGSATAPNVTGVSLTPGTGNVVAGNTVLVTVTTDKAVSVSNGTPALALSDGGTATYDPTRSTSTSLVFSNVVRTGETSPDLGIVGSSLNGATIAAADGSVLSLAGAATNPAGILTVGLGQGTGGTDGNGTGGNGTGGSGTGGSGTGSGGSGTTPSYGTIPIYRFFDSVNGTHFYTPNAGERATILQTRPDLIPEGSGGVGLYASDPASGDPNASAVYRFFDKIHGTQFLTASVSERDSVIANRADLTYEPGGTFYEHTQEQAGDTAVYRFFSSKDGTHFYTDSASERATILQTRPDLVAEGIGFYEPKHA